MTNDAKIAVQKELTSPLGILKPPPESPAKWNWVRCISGTILVKKYKAKTFVTQAKKPRVNKFKGKRRIFSSGSKTRFITVKTSPALKRVGNPPL